MSRSSVYTRKPDFCYILSTQASSTYETRSRYHPSSFIPNLATNGHVQSHLGLLRPIASHLGLLRATSFSLGLFLRISSYFIIFHHILPYSVLFHHASALFGTRRHAPSWILTEERKRSIHRHTGVQACPTFQGLPYFEVIVFPFAISNQ